MPFSDVHLQLHSIRATELRAEAAAFHFPADRGRTRLGRLLVELGLRPIEHPTRTRVRPV